MSEDLGKQVELQSQLNKLLQDRIKLQNQLNEACGKQCAQGDAMNKAAEQAAGNQQKNVAETEKLSKAQDKARKSQDKQSKSADGFFSSMSTGTAAGVGGIMGLVSGFKDMGMSLGGAGKLLKSFTKSIFSVGAAIIAIPFKMFSGLVGMANNMAGAGTALRQAFEDVRKEFGSFAEGPAKNVIAGFKDMRSSAGNLAGTGLAASRVFGYGPDGMAKMMGAVADIAKGLGPAINLLGDEFGKNAEKAVMFSKGLGLSGEQMGKLMKDAKLSGQSQSDMMTEVGSMSLQMAKKFGLSSKDIGRDIADMKADFVSFGNMSTAQMGAASAYARKLGMDMKDLKGVVDKFDDFEGAADSVSQLNQAFGIQLDTMKMMNAENPAERIDMMRNAFHAAGKSIENMTRQEKKLLMAQTGLSESALKNAFAAENQGIAYEDFADAAGDAEENQLSQEEVMLKLAKAIEKIAEAGQSFTGIGDAFGKGFMRAMSQDKKMRALMMTIRQFLRAVFDFGKGIGKVFMRIMKESGMLDGLMDLFDPTKFRAFFDDILITVEKFADFLIDGKGNPEDILQEFVDKITNFIGGKGQAMGQIGNAFLRLGEFLLVTLKVVGQFIWKKAKPYLMSAFNFLGEWFSQNWKPIAMFIAKYAIAPLFVLAMIKGAAFALGGALIKILAAKMVAMIMASSATAAAGAAAGGAAPAAAGFGAFFTSFAAIPLAVIGKATLILMALVTVFAFAVVAFAGAVTLASMMLEKVSWEGFAKTLVVVGVSIAATIGLMYAGMQLTPFLPVMVPMGLALLGAAALFTVALAAFSGGIWLVSKILDKTPFFGFVKQLAMVGLAIGATAGLMLLGPKAIAGMPFYIPFGLALVAAAAFFTAGVGAYSTAILAVTKITEGIKWMSFVKALGGVGLAVAATVGLFAAGALMAFGGLGFVVAAVGLKAGAAFFEGAITIFANAIKDSVPAFNVMYKNREAVSFGLLALDKILVSITKLKKVAKSFGIMSALFGGGFTKGVKAASDFFKDTVPSIKAMIDAISQMKVSDPKSTKLKIQILGAVVSAMQSLGKMGIEVAELALVSKLLGGGTMTEIIHSMSVFMSSVGKALESVILSIVQLSESFPDGKEGQEKAKIVAQTIAAVAQLASAMFEPLKVVTDLGGGMFGPGPTETMDAVVKGVKDIMSAIKTELPALVKMILKLGPEVGDPKSAEPKMKVISMAIEAMGKFATGLGDAMKLVPSGKTAWYKRDKNMDERIGDMMKGVFGVITALSASIGFVVKEIINIDIGADPKTVGPKVKAIADAIAAMATFTTMIGKLKGYVSGDATGLDVIVSHIASQIANAISGDQYNLGHLFTALSTFTVDSSALKKLDDVNVAMTTVGKFFKSLAKVSDRTAKTFSGYSSHYFGPDGVIAQATTDIVESYNTTYQALQNLTAEPIDLKMRMADFADAMGVSRETFKIKNEQLNFTVNIKVDLDAEKMVDQLSDKKTMGKRTVQLAAGS